MTKTYICSECGQEVNGYKDQCPYCKVSSDNLIENIYGSYDHGEEYINDHKHEWIDDNNE